MTIDIASIRKDFPILQREVHGKPLVYLDNAATSQKPRQVIDTLVRYYEEYNSNIHRAVHALGEEATAAYEEAREKTRKFINAPVTESIIFTRNTTESINLVAYTWGREHIGEGDEIVLTHMEHHSNLIPWLRLAQEKGAKVRYVTLTPDFKLDIDYGKLFTKRTKLMAMPHVSNSLGTINPVVEIAAAARREGVTLLVDGAQGAPHLPVDVHAIGCDFYAFSSHKMLGPTGIGVLYGRPDLLEEMQPFLGGGEMIRKVTFEDATWNDLPWKFEAGTPNIADAIAFGAALDYLTDVGMENVREHEIEITEYALRKMRQQEDITLYGPPEAIDRGGVVSFNLIGVHAHDVGTVLDRHGVAIRSGHHCTQPLWRSLGETGSARASFYIYNTLEEVEALIESITAAREFFANDK